MSFTYNQFANPNASGIYYSTHFHDPNTGINYNHSHVHDNSHIHSYKGYHVHTNTNPMRSWLIRETINDSSKPIFRSHFTSGTETSSSVLMNPNSRDDAAKFRFSDPPSATEKASDTGNAAANKAAVFKSKFLGILVSLFSEIIDFSLKVVIQPALISLSFQKYLGVAL